MLRFLSSRVTSSRFPPSRLRLAARSSQLQRRAGRLPEVVEDRGTLRSIGGASRSRSRRGEEKKKAKARCRVLEGKTRVDGSRAKVAHLDHNLRCCSPLICSGHCGVVRGFALVCGHVCPPVRPCCQCARVRVCVRENSAACDLYCSTERRKGGRVTEQTKQRREPELGGGTCCCSHWLLHLHTHI